MTKRVFLHGGHFKTGTTSAQKALAAHRPLLAQHGFLYPEPAIAWFPWQHGVMLAVRNPERRTESLAELRALLQAFRAGPAHTLILSAEMLSSYREEEFAYFRELLADFDSTFVLTMRHWSGFLRSRWLQNIRNGDTRAYPAFVRAIAEHFERTADGDFSLVLHRARAATPRLLVNYYHAAHVNQALFALFGLPPDLSMRLLSGQQAENVSAGFLQHEMQRIANDVVAAHTGGDGGKEFRDTVDFSNALLLGTRIEAFMAERSNACRDLEALIERARQATNLAALRAPVAHWTDYLSTRLAALGLPAPPPDWGAEEIQTSTAFTTLSADDLPEALRASLLERML